jgi:hypothetical protein
VKSEEGTQEYETEEICSVCIEAAYVRYAVGNLRADYPTHLYPQKLALTSPTSSSRSVGVVRSLTQATEFFFVLYVRYRHDMSQLVARNGVTKCKIGDTVEKSCIILTSFYNNLVENPN